MPGATAYAHSGKSWYALSRGVDGDFTMKSSKSCCGGEGHLELLGGANLQEMQDCLKSALLVFGFFFPGVITGASCNHRELRLMRVSLACEDVAGLLKRTKDNDLNMVSEAGRCLRAQPDEVYTGIASCQDCTLVTQM